LEEFEMARSMIEWTGFVWNIMLGCSKCSPGCKFCYAVNEVARERCEAHKGLAVLKPIANWNGNLRFRPESLSQPLHRKSPTKWFVNSLSDYFHEHMPLEWQKAGLEVMRMADWHIFQVLTKRDQQLNRLLGNELNEFARLPNVMWGVSVEDCKHGLPRIDALRESAARIKWLSIEPLLEDLGDLNLEGIDWVVAGGESGHQARPVKQEWILAIKESCERQGVPFFFKQWGNWAPAVEPTKGRVHVWPDNTSSVRMHKKLAGRSLLNETHDGCFEFESLAVCPHKAECDSRLLRCAEIAASISVLDVDQYENPMTEEAEHSN